MEKEKVRKKLKYVVYSDSENAADVFHRYA